MATLDVIRTLTLRAKAEGFLEAQKQVRELGETYDTSAKKQLSVDKSLQSLQRRYDQEFRAQQELAKVARTLDMARAQGLVTQDRANALMQQAIRHHNQAGTASKTHAAALQELSAAAASSASSLGTVGAILVRLGPAGIAAGAALAAVAGAMTLASKAALDLAEKAGRIRDLSETTGFTTDQLQALNRVAAQTGVDAGQLGSGLERFAASMDEVQDRTGKAFEALQGINPALARQVSNARSAAEAWDLVAKALAQADVQQRAVLSRALFGRGGTGIARVLGGTAEAGGINQFVAAMRQADLITQEQVKHWDDLGDTINENLRQAQQNIVATFAGPTLEALKTATEALRDMSAAIQQTNWDDFLSFWQKWGAIIPVIGPPLFVIANAIKLIQSFRGETPATMPEAVPGLPPVQRISEGFEAINALRDAQEQQRRTAIQAANDNQRYINALGGTATPAEQLRNKIIQLNKDVAENRITADQAAEASKRLNAEFGNSRARANAAAIGEAATVTEKYREQVRQLQEQFAKGEISADAMRRGIQGLADESTVSALERQVSVLGDAATQAEKTEAAIARLNLQFKTEQITLDTYNRKLMQLNPVFKTVQDAIADLGSAMAQAFIQGADAAEAFNASLKSIASTAASEAIRNLIRGDIVGAGISAAVAGVAAIGAAIFEGDEEDPRAAQELAAAQQKMAEEARRAAEALGAATDSMKELVNTIKGPFETALEDGRRRLEDMHRVVRESNAAQRILILSFGPGSPQGRAAADAINEAQRRLREAEDIFSEFIGNLRRDFVENLQSKLREAQGQGFLNQFFDLLREIRQARSDAAALGVDVGGLIDELFHTQAQRLVNDLKLTGDQFQILRQTFPELRDVVVEFNEAVQISKRSVDELRRASESLDDRILAATVDASTLEGALTLFDRQAQREREQEIREGGENLVLLEQALAVERFNVIREFNDRAIEEERRAAQERIDQINATAKSIVTYLNSLLAGPQSSLSPAARLAASQSAFQSQLLLAQQGNLEAQQSITQFAEDFRVAARDFFGSGVGFQQIQQQIISALGGLPAVQEATDPVVQALAEVVGAVNGTTTAVGGTTAAVGGTTSAVDQTKTQLSSDLSVQTALQNSANSLSASANSLATSANAVLSSIESLNTAANATLITINTSLSVLLSIESLLDQIKTSNSNIEARSNEIRNFSSHMYAPGGSLNFTLQSGGWVPGQIGGGTREFKLASGGAVGTDTIPAMLTPGEFVVRRQAAQMNVGGLTALNATGMWPANDNMVRELQRVGGMLASLLANIAELGRASNMAIERNTQATKEQTSELARESRFAERKRTA
jgi:hypothetical protein